MIYFVRIFVSGVFFGVLISYLLEPVEIPMGNMEEALEGAPYDGPMTLRWEKIVRDLSLFN